VNGMLFFRADDGTSGSELWMSDGTADGTVMVKDINPGSDSSYPYYLTEVNGRLFFSPYDGNNGRELWMSNGTADGTVMVKDINPGSGSSYPLYLTEVNGTLFFSPDDGTSGSELWLSNGTADGTVMVKDIKPGSGSSYPSYLTNVNGTLFFRANGGTSGSELWMSDGTADGTVMVKDINPGSGSSYPSYLTEANGTLFFRADDGTNGQELRGLELGFDAYEPNITVNTKKAKVSWDHNDIHLDGQLYFPKGVWTDNLNPGGSAVITLAGVEVTNQSVNFEIKGKKNDKWKYKDKENFYGNIKEFKIDWKGAKFNYHGDEGLHIHTHLIDGTDTTFCIHSGHVSGAFTVTINETMLAYDEWRNITTDVEYEPQKDDNTHVHFTIPFQLTSDMTIEVSGAIKLNINVANYYKEGFAKIKLVSIFNSELFHDGTDSLSASLGYVITLGDGMDMISVSDLMGVEKGWTKKDDKHWEYK
jgi:ELWxxDGT repeat protein